MTCGDLAVALDGNAEHTKAEAAVPFVQSAPAAARRTAVVGRTVPAEIAVNLTFFHSSGMDPWLASLAPHATSVPSAFNARS